MYFIIFFINQGNAVRRALFSTLLLEHVSALIRLGLPLNRGVAPCGQEVSRFSRRDLAEVQKGLGSGELLGDALARVPTRRRALGALIYRFLCFLQFRARAGLVSPAEAEVLRIGERSGNLRDAMQLILDERERSRDVQRLLWNEFVYPLALAVMIGGMITVYFVYIMPAWAHMYRDFDVTLPPWIGKLMAVPVGQLFALAFFLVFLGLLIRRMTRRARSIQKGRSGIRQSLRRIVFMLPFVQGAIKRLFLVEFCREMAMLLRVDIPADRALAVLADGTLHPLFRDQIGRARNMVHQGYKLSDALERAGLDDRTVGTVRMAESASDLPDALSALADEYAARTTWAANMIAQFIPPLLILLLGAIVGSLAVAIFLPLVELIFELMRTVP